MAGDRVIQELLPITLSMDTLIRLVECFVDEVECHGNREDFKEDHADRLEATVRAIRRLMQKEDCNGS